MEMHQLRYFVAVARAGHFTRAAELCGVSQPSLSQQILNLEKHLQQRLFDRLGRRVLLTDAGRLLLDRATTILAAVEDAERCLRDRDAGQAGRLAVGAIPTIAPYLLPAALERYLGLHPNVEVAVEEDVTARLIPAVAAGELDLAVVALPIDDEHLEAEALFSEPLLLALPPGHRLARRRSVTLDDLREERFILLNDMHCLGDQVLSFCRGKGCQPRIACRSAQIATIEALIAAGQGVSLLPAMARRADRSGRRVYLPLAGEQPTRTVAAVWHKQRYHTLAAERFLAALRLLGVCGPSRARSAAE
jgi:LysR family hydrogen peroxide-inducible transcriptional activator